MTTSQKRSANDYLDAWRRQHGDLPAAGFILRERLRNWWGRCPYFSDDRRVPSNDAEAERVVFQLSSVIAKLFDSEYPLLLFLYSYDRPSSELAQGLSLDPLPTIVPTWKSALETFVDPSDLILYAGEADPAAAPIRKALLAAATDQIGGLTIWSANSPNLLCPYDGGADFFTPDGRQREAVKGEWSVARGIN
jgi:hypothetical protein